MSRDRRLHKIRMQVTPGAAPGTLLTHQHAGGTTLRVMAYSPEGHMEEEVEDLDTLAALRERWPVVWVNVDGLGDEAVLRTLGRQFGIHRLALEDVVNLGQRAKVELYDDHLFMVLRMPAAPPRKSEQVSAFVGDGYVLTFQERPGDCFEPVRQRIRDGKGRIRHKGPGYLAYALADAVIDSHFPVLEALEDRLDRLEHEVFSSPEKNTVQLIQELKGDLRELWRAARPHRDMLAALLHDEAPFVSDGTEVYIRDALDHATQVMDLAESYREAAADLLGAYLSSVSNRMNEVMKILTIIAAVFIPLSFIAGVYGMNFDRDASGWNMPELGWRFGYPFALGLMLGSALLMLLYFWRKGWFR